MQIVCGEGRVGHKSLLAFHYDKGWKYIYTINNLSIHTHGINSNDFLNKNLYTHPNLSILWQTWMGFIIYHYKIIKQDFNTSIHLHNEARCMSSEKIKIKIKILKTNLIWLKMFFLTFCIPSLSFHIYPYIILFFLSLFLHKKKKFGDLDSFCFDNVKRQFRILAVSSGTW